MARLQNGILGGFKGRIGEVEGYIRNGIPYIRNKKRKTKVPPTLRQLSQRQKMAVVSKFLITMTSFVRLGFSTVAKGQAYTANNAAKSYLINNALVGDYPDIRIDYPSVCLARGKLNMPNDIQVAWQGNGVLFSWSYNPILNWEHRRARAMTLIHEPITQKSYYFLTGACMNEVSQFIELPPAILNKPVHAYLSFATEDQLQVGNSQYFKVT